MTSQVWRNSLREDQCGDVDSVDIESQPKDMSLAHRYPELALVAIYFRSCPLRCTKVVSTINLGFAVTACAVSPDGSEAIMGRQDGKLYFYSINGDAYSTLQMFSCLLQRMPIEWLSSGTMYPGRYVGTEKPKKVRYLGVHPIKRKILLNDFKTGGDVLWDEYWAVKKQQVTKMGVVEVRMLSMVATGSLDTCVLLFEIGKTASSCITIKGSHLDGVYGLAFTDENSVVSFGEDTCIRLWRLIPQQ
ncbi:transducin family protein [Actinidia rufa]|uniref:Transducin family protein n=1 Tax=Actinidia rufa TaxID=165716 RepID=A0A7J0EN31_9ERIC|nr:transducin family protein [Actinidia rufa]